MTNDEQPSAIVQAFDKVVPIDEGHAAKLAKTRERIAEIGRRTAREVAAMNWEIRENQDRAAASKAILEEKARVTKELNERMREELDQQLTLLSSIVGDRLS